MLTVLLVESVVILASVKLAESLSTSELPSKSFQYGMFTVLPSPLASRSNSGSIPTMPEDRTAASVAVRSNE